LNRPVRCEFTYGVPPDFEEKIAPGMRVAVPLASRREVGVVVARRTESTLETKKIKYVALVLDEEALVGPDLLELTQWMAGYYACSWGEALSAVLPAALKREGGARRITRIRALA